MIYFIYTTLELCHSRDESLGIFVCLAHSNCYKYNIYMAVYKNSTKNIRKIYPIPTFSLRLVYMVVYIYLITIFIFLYAKPFYLMTYTFFLHLLSLSSLFLF